MDTTEAQIALRYATAKLSERAANTRLNRDYYEGRQRTHLHSPDFTNPHRAVIERVRDNQCRRVVNLTVDRLTVTGFQGGSDSQAPSIMSDTFAQRAWLLWKASRMGLRLDNWIRGAEITGKQASIIVDTDESGQVRFYPQQPEQVFAETDPINPTKTLWAVKLWRGTDNRDRATVYTAGAEHHLFVGPERGKYVDPVEAVETVFQSYSYESSYPNKMPGVCPVFVADIGYSDLDDVIPLQDLVNAELQREAVSGEAFSFSTRVWLGLEMEIDRETGEKKAPFEVSTNRQYFIPPGIDGERVEVKDLPGQDPTPFLNAANAHRMAVARASNTPAYLLLSGGDYPSGEARRAAEASFISKIESRQAYYGSAIADAASYAVLLDAASSGAQLLDVPVVETSWRRADVTAERDAMFVVKELAGLGVPVPELLVHYMGWSPEMASEVFAGQDGVAEVAVPSVEPPRNPDQVMPFASGEPV